MNKTALNDVHERAGARMGEFAGWWLPIDYGSAIREARAVRDSAGIFDVSHMGRLEFLGADALSVLQMLFTNDAGRLEDGAGQYTLMCNAEGGVIDDLIVFRKSEDHFLAVVNASNLENDEAWMFGLIPPLVTLVDETLVTSLFAIQGPRSAGILAAAGLAEAADVPRFHFVLGQIAGNEVLASRTGYTGEDGFEIACRNDSAEQVWAALLDAGQEYGLAMCGLAARDILRIEAGLPLYGHELDENTTPVEAGLMRWVKLEKGDFIGRDAIEDRVRRGPSRRLLGIQMHGRPVPRHGDVVQTPVGEGAVTSGAFSPTLGHGMAIAYLPPEAVEGMPVEVSIHGKNHPGLVRNLPIYRAQGK
ncbi:MAG: glycine cleavage system aminomethyltransferase GcvT [Armatimonadetes bacterium]|nr:glycine cleavage system aminomethyltransferase GcvT [Armatimonadota bacterium]